MLCMYMLKRKLAALPERMRTQRLSCFLLADSTGIRFCASMIIVRDGEDPSKTHRKKIRMGRTQNGKLLVHQGQFKQTLPPRNQWTHNAPYAEASTRTARSERVQSSGCYVRACRVSCRHLNARDEKASRTYPKRSAAQRKHILPHPEAEASRHIAMCVQTRAYT